MVTRALFTALLLLVATQRALELRQSRRNEAWIRARGGREHAAWQMPWMRALHAAWLVSSLLEVWLAHRPFVPWLAAVAAAAFVAGQVLRLTAMRTLGARWTVRVMTIPGAPLVKRGIYRHVRHPNYLGVALEIAAFPLIHSAYVTSAVFTALNALLLRWRIRAEEAALRGAAAARADAGAA
jgi:methyltransferase